MVGPSQMDVGLTSVGRPMPARRLVLMARSTRTLQFDFLRRGDASSVTPVASVERGAPVPTPVPADAPAPLPPPVPAPDAVPAPAPAPAPASILHGEDGDEWAALRVEERTQLSPLLALLRQIAIHPPSREVISTFLDLPIGAAAYAATAELGTSPQGVERVSTSNQTVGYLLLKVGLSPHVVLILRHSATTRGVRLRSALRRTRARPSCRLPSTTVSRSSRPARRGRTSSCSRTPCCPNGVRSSGLAFMSFGPSARSRRRSRPSQSTPARTGSTSSSTLGS